MNLSCCDGLCVDETNDIHNCGGCGISCPGPHPYCSNGTCGVPQCTRGPCAEGETCCGGSCCIEGELCCLLEGPTSYFDVCTAPMNGTCPPEPWPPPQCASPDTPILAADGPRAIDSLRNGDLVYSVDHGQVALVPIARIHRSPANHHFVVHVLLSNGATLDISGPHPTADGRTFAELRAGEQLDGVRIVAAQTMPYAHPYTYDILPASDSGTYFAGGVLIGSTLAPVTACYAH